MAKILIAGTSTDFEAMKRILGNDHELSTTGTTSDALEIVNEQVFDLVMIGVHFDDSRMFDLLRQMPANLNTAIICFCTKDTPLTRTMHDSVDVASQALGAWIYLDQHEYNVSRDPDAEMRSVIERCLTAEAQKKTQFERRDISKQRAELQRLREALERYEWSDNLESRVVALRQNLAAVLLHLCQLQVDNLNQQEQIENSRERKDRVSEAVQLSEYGAMREDRRLLLDETNQTVKEVEIGAREEKKRRHKTADERKGTMPEKPDRIETDTSTNSNCS